MPLLRIKKMLLLIHKIIICKKNPWNINPFLKNDVLNILKNEIIQ